LRGILPYREPEPIRYALKAEHRRALALLASSPHGCTEAIIVAYGIGLGVMVDLVRAGYASARWKRRSVGRERIGVVVVTEDGRRALAEAPIQA
jgi:hypothetical protein